MSNATIYIRKKNQETWDAIPSGSDFINNVLTQLRYQQQAKEKALKQEQKNEETNAKTPTQTKKSPIQA